MLFRHGLLDDIPDCVALLRRERSCRLSPDVWAALPTLWEHILTDGGLAALQVFESGGRLLAFRFSAFVNDEFAFAYMKAPRRQVAATVWRQAFAGNSPLLDRQAIARANARGELNLVVLHAVSRKRDPAHPLTTRLLTMLPAAFQVAHAGYRIRRLVSYEVFDESSARIMGNIGFLPYTLAESCSGGPPDEEAVPTSWVFFWDPFDKRFPAVPIMTAATLGSPPPRFRLSPAQQRLLLAALEGRSDREIASSYGVRPDTLRQTWETIYRRVDEVAPRLLASIDEGRDGRRGGEKRRNLIEYCRQHLEELRPWDWREARLPGGTDNVFQDTLFMDTLFQDSLRGASPTDTRR